MAQQFSDAARSDLTAGISAGDTTIALADGSRFPEADAGTSAVSDGNLWFKAVLQDETGFEIVYVRTHAVATTPNMLSNVMRGQEGTTARSFAATSVIGVRLTASDMSSLWARMATKAAASHTHAQSNITGLDTAFAGKQATLVSGANIKTVGGQSLLGGGDIPMSGGGGSLPVTSISTNTTAVKTNAYMATAGVTLTLPASPTVNDEVGFMNASNTATCVIARNGSLLMGLSEDMTVDKINAGFTLVYTGATKGWWVR